MSIDVFKLISNPTLASLSNLVFRFIFLPLFAILAQMSDSGMMLTWTYPQSLPANTDIKYIVNYRSTYEMDMITGRVFSIVFAIFPKTGGLALTNGYQQMLDTGFPFLTFGLATRGNSVVIPTSYLQAGPIYEVQILGFTTNLTLSSSRLRVDTNAGNFTVSDLKTYAGAWNLAIQWNQSSDPIVIGYDISIQASLRGNAGTVFDYTSSKVIFNSLLPKNTTFFNVSCFSFILDPSNPCIYPFTQYIVSMQVMRSSGLNGAPQTVTVTTQDAPPQGTPTLQLKSNGNSVSTSNTNSVINYDGSTSIGAPSTLFIPSLPNAIYLFGNTYTDHISLYVDFPTDPNTYLYVCNITYVFETSGGEAALNPTPNVVTTAILSQYTPVPFVINGLLPFSSISVFASISTRFGVIASPVYVITTAQAVPPALSPPSVTMSGSNAILVVTWDPPSPLPGVILYYELADTLGNALYIGNHTSAFLPSTKKNVNMRVRATTVTGTGPWSMSINPAAVFAAEANSNASSSPSSSIFIAVPVVASILALFAGFLLILFIRHRRYRNSADYAFEKMKANIAPEVLQALESIHDGHRKVPRQINVHHIFPLELLGEGKFGTVHKALLDESETNNTPGFLVAVKTSKAEIDDEHRQEMLMEAVIMAQFTHNNIVNLIGHAVDHDTGAIVLVSQYCEHGSMVTYLQNHDPDDIHYLLLDFACDIASGMAYIADLGFVHRDLAVKGKDRVLAGVTGGK